MTTRPITFAITLLALAFPAAAVSQTTVKSAEVMRLQEWVGQWAQTGKMRDDPAKPFKAIAGAETCKWAASGYAVMCEEKNSGAGGGWSGVYIISYDAAGKQYHVHGTEAPGNNMHAVGQVDGAKWTWFTDTAPDGSMARYIFEPAGKSGRTMKVSVGSGDAWAIPRSAGSSSV